MTYVFNYETYKLVYVGDLHRCEHLRQSMTQHIYITWYAYAKFVQFTPSDSDIYFRTDTTINNCPFCGASWHIFNKVQCTNDACENTVVEHHTLTDIAVCDHCAGKSIKVLEENIMIEVAAGQHPVKTLPLEVYDNMQKIYNNEINNT